MPGLRFLKLDLHIHTPASTCYRDKGHTALQIVHAAVQQGLAAIAVTDHNSAEWIDSIKTASEGTGLVVFPGVEISMSGFHLVALFDPTSDQRHVESFLGAIDITPNNYGRQDALCTKDPYSVFEKIHERHGLAILAHIDRPKGYFHERARCVENGRVQVPIDCSKLLNDNRYDAVECIDGRLPEGFDAAHHFTRFPAFYQSSDNPDPGAPTKHSMSGIGSKYSWFNLDEVNLEGLRQCFADPEVRICMMDDRAETNYPRIVSMQVGRSGFLNNQKLDFHGGLNSIIGGKGVGKSLAIEFIRFALDQLSSEESFLEDVAKKLEKRLELNNTVEVVYQIADGTQYLVTRKYTGTVRGTKKPSSQVDCKNLRSGEPYDGDIPHMFPVLAYSQTEVIKIAESKDAQLELLDRLIDTRRHEQALAEVQGKLDENDSLLSEAIAAKGRLDSCEQQIHTLTEQVDAINRSLQNPLFSRMKEAEGKGKRLNDSSASVARLAGFVQKWRKESAREPMPTLDEKEQKDAHLSQAHQLSEAALTHLRATMECLEQEMAGFGTQFSLLLALWQPEFDLVAAEYETLLQSLGGDQTQKESERRELQRDIDVLTTEASGYQARISDLEPLMMSRTKLLDEFEGAARRMYDLRKSKYDEITILSEGKLKVELHHASNRSAFADALSDMLKGGSSATPAVERRKISDTMAPRRFVQLVLDHNKIQLAEEANLTPLWAERVIEKMWAPGDLVELLALQHRFHPTDVPGIQFCKGGSDYAELNELSVGQKSTALLIIALCDGIMPVIIDQPEDALDIVSIWQDIAKKLRRSKHKRQFILTTHNSSLAVAADSDQFIVMKAVATSGRVTVSGAIDRLEVSREVMTHLEGGNEPYDLRSKKYNRA